MSDDEVAVRLGGGDIGKLKEWYKDIAGIENESDADFDKRFEKFLGDHRKYGSNHRIMGRFFNLNDHPGDHAKLEFFHKIYHHQACGGWAANENWYWRLAFLVGLWGLALVVGLDFLQRVHAEEWDSLSWLKFFVFFAVAGLAVAFFLIGDKIIGFLKGLKEDNAR